MQHIRTKQIIRIQSYIHVYTHIQIHTYIYIYICMYMQHTTEGSLEVKLPTIWADGKSGVGRVREGKKRRKKIKEEKESVRRSKAAKHCVSPMIRGSGGSKSGLAKAAGAEPCGQMRDEKLHAVVARSIFPSQNAQNTPTSDHFWKLWCRLKVQMWLRGRRKRFCTLPKVSKREGFVAFPKTMASVGHLQRICADAFRVAGARQQTCSSEMLGGRGADFLRRVAFWSIRSSVLGGWFCVACAALRMTWHHFLWQAQYFRQVEWKNRKTYWYEAVSSLCTQLSIFEGSLAELLRF